MLKTTTPKTLLTLLALLFVSSIYGQFYGDITQVQSTTTQEGALADYTITSLAADDQGTGESAVAVGQRAAIYFPNGFELTTISSVNITIGNVTTPITGFISNGVTAIAFDMPVDIPAGTGFSLQVNNVRNAAINAACGTTANTYYSAAPCDGQIVFYTMNTLDDVSRPNVYNHFGVARFDITAVPYFIQEVVVEKSNLSGVFENAVAEEIIRIRVNIGGSLGNLPVLNSLDFAVGNTQLTSIEAIDFWSTPTGTNFPSGNDTNLGSTAPATNASFAPNLMLNPGNNYFWITYDIACYYGLVGEVLDGELSNIRIGGQTYTPNSPTGIRSIIQNPSIGTSNLVPNPSFETFSSCPNGIGQINSADNWGAIPITATSYLPSSPDFYHNCDQTGSFADVPTNGFGFQEPRTGDGYAGIYTTGFFDWKEYLQVQLATPLQAGETYAVTYFVAGADYDQTGGYNIGVRHDGLGFMLSPTQVTAPFSIYGVPPTMQPQYVGNVIVTDDVEWVPVTAQYTAQGGEQWLVIGCFIDGPNLNKVATSGFGYYYIDDVSVSPISSIPPTACTPIELLIEITPETCPGDIDGTADVQIFGGNAPFTVAWSDSGTGTSRTNLAPGTYSLTVTDASNFTRTDLVNIPAGEAPQADLVITSASSTSSNDGSIQTTMTTGAAPYTFAWSTGASTPNINNLSVGTYGLTVTDANSCVNVISAFVGAESNCSKTHRNFPYEYDLERNLGLFRQNQDDDVNWRRRNSPTPTGNTGPSAPQSGDYYRYLESSNNNNQNKTGALTTNKCLDITGLSLPIFSFYYNLNGSDMGELFVQLSTDGGTTWTGPVWQTNGDQGDNWQRATIYLDSYSSASLRIRIVGRTGNGPRSDMAIDSYYVGEFTNTFLRGEPTPLAEGTTDQISQRLIEQPMASLRLYPNPNSGAFNLNWQQVTDGTTQLRIVDQLGRLMHTQQFESLTGPQHRQLQLNLAPGLYFIELAQDDHRFRQSLVIIP